MKDERIYLEHIIDCIDRINEYTQKLSAELKAQYPEINWKAISGFRNILVHNYLGLDLPEI